jgi:hypothetical protein
MLTAPIVQPGQFPIRLTRRTLCFCAPVRLGNLGPAIWEWPMDQLIILAAGLAGVAGILASLSLVRRTRVPKESPYAVSTEGEKRCPKCGMGNLVSDARCISCGADLPG